MSLIVSGHQPTYLPWLGLFHKIALADIFVVMDDAQYLEQDWNNRNRVKGSTGALWLAVPIDHSGPSLKPIKDVRIHSQVAWGSTRHWQLKQWKSIELCYRKAPFWDQYAAPFADLYTGQEHVWLGELNHKLLLLFLQALQLTPRLVISSEAGFVGRKSDLVLEHATKFGADVCVVGMHGHDYIAQDDFYRAGVSLHFQDYRHPAYPQRFGDFISHLSVLDLIMNCGPDSRDILCGGNVDKAALKEEAAAGKPRRLGAAIQ